MTAVTTSGTSEPQMILAFARSAYRDLTALLAGRHVLDSARDGEWSLRDLLRHAIAVELRYRAQVLWSAQRADEDPIAIPATRLPCDRLTPPVPEFAETEAGPAERVLALLASARAATDDELARLDSTSLGRPSLWGTAEVDVRERLHQIGVHIVEVVVQTEKMLGTTESEVRRVVRRIAATRGLHEAVSERRVLDELDSELVTLANEVLARGA